MPVEHRLHSRCGGAFEHGSSGRPFILPSSTHHFERSFPFAIEHLALEVTLHLDAKSISATASLDVRRVDPAAEEVALDAVGFEISDLRIDRASASWRYDGRTLFVKWDPRREKGRISIAYRATPRRGLYFLEPDEHYPRAAAPSLVAVSGGGCAPFRALSRQPTSKDDLGDRLPRP